MQLILSSQCLFILVQEKNDRQNILIWNTSSKRINKGGGIIESMENFVTNGK
jgi:hypothetical protein